ncbi:MAG: hypothetical protein HWN67_12845 [Candidatus Helarchaeota archaeon]|nr:hypothetical protein [Candidatus Helarchaeota archaeon]
MMIEGLNICSYYTGLPEEGKDQFYVALILEDTEDPSIYEESLVETIYEIVEQRKKPNFNDILKSYFEKIPKFLTLVDSQRFSFIFKNPTRILILRKLTEGAIIKEVLRKWLSDRVGEDVLDLDGLLMPFFKSNILKEFKIPTEVSPETECLFLIKDVFFMRVPVEKMIKQFGKKAKVKKPIFRSYREEVQRFFKKYKLEEKDTKECSKLFSDPDSYSIISALRQNFQEKEALVQSVKLNLPSVDSILRALKKINMVKEIKEKDGKEIIYLLNDIAYPTFFPEYMVDSIRRRWGERNISQNLALKHLQLIRGIFQGLSPEVAMFGTRAAMLMKKEEEELASKEKAKVKIKVPAKPKVKKKAIVKPKAKRVVKVKPKPKLPRVKPILDRKQIVQLKKDQKDELVKVKRAIKNKLFDVALAPLERAKKIGMQLVEIKEEGAEEELQKILILEKEIHKKLKIEKKEEAKKAPVKKEIIEISEEEKISLREERKKVMEGADGAIDKENFNDGVRFLERAAIISEQLGEIKLADEIWTKVRQIRQLIKKESNVS